MAALDEKHDAKFEEVGAFESPAIIQPAVRPEDPATVEERRLVRKLDRRILPIACLMYLFACQYHHIGLVSSNSLRRGQTWTGLIWVTLGYRA